MSVPEKRGLDLQPVLATPSDGGRMAGYRGAWLKPEMLDSKAFKSLGPSAQKVYIGLQRRRQVKKKRRHLQADERLRLLGPMGEVAP